MMNQREYDEIREILKSAGKPMLIRRVEGLVRHNSHLKLTVKDVLPNVDWWDDAHEWMKENEAKDSVRLVKYIIAGLLCEYRKLLIKFDMVHDAIADAHDLLEQEVNPL
ncbi:MAG: hypothetical protein O6945_05025 [Gammaproteobacteria bacterium]|nr:hypothetical protein [Gammaproteobacteria bacterium]